ncbi:MAG: hypothetical protein ISP81_06325 [Synechococcus sp. BS301-5m-G54]|nr:hypothetical protein [Synechococcus sp. BS301-5m-G54]
MTSATSDDLSGRAYYYYSSSSYGSSQTSDSESETTASEDAESSDEADDDTIKIYVNSGSFRAPYFSFFTDSSRSVSFGTNELDVSKTYEFIGANSTHPFYIGDSRYRQESSTALVLDGDGSASGGIGRDQSFTLSFAADIDLSLIDSIDYFCTAHSSMIGSFQLVGEPLGRQDANDEEAEIVVPTISVSTDDTSLTSGETARITFTLSEGSTDFTADDLTVSGGVVSDFEAISATEYTVVFTPDVESTDNGTVTVAAGSFSNSAGTTNDSSASLSMGVDTRDQVSPVLEIIADDEELTAGETATIRFTLTEASSDFTAEDVAVSGGELSGFSGSGTDYSASFTPAENSTDEGVITVVRGAFRDAAGNINAERTSISLEVNTVPPVSVATPQSEPPVELFVSAGSFAEPYYTFYTDAEGNEPLVDPALDVDSTYLFRRLDDVSSHPFYVSDQGHNQTSSSALILQGDGSAERGIKGTESFQLSFSEDIDLDVVETVDYYCSSHPSMISSFRLFRGSDAILESASDAETDDADAPLGFAFASQDVSASSEAEDDSDSTADVALSTVDVLTGDVNNNGSHDVSDAISVLRNIVGLETDLSEFPGVDPVTLMDIDGSGSIDVGDAVGILRAIVGLESLTSLVQVSLQAPADLSNALLLDPQGLQADPLASDPSALLL